MKNLLLDLKLLFFRMRDSMAIRYSVGSLVMSHFVCVGVYEFSAFWTSVIATFNVTLCGCVHVHRVSLKSHVVGLQF